MFFWHSIVINCKLWFFIVTCVSDVNCHTVLEIDGGSNYCWRKNYFKNKHNYQFYQTRVCAVQQSLEYHKGLF